MLVKGKACWLLYLLFSSAGDTYDIVKPGARERRNMESHSCVPAKMILVLKSTSSGLLLAIPGGFYKSIYYYLKKNYNHGLIKYNR